MFWGIFTYNSTHSEIPDYNNCVSGNTLNLELSDSPSLDVKNIHNILLFKVVLIKAMETVLTHTCHITTPVPCNCKNFYVHVLLLVNSIVNWTGLETHFH